GFTGALCNERISAVKVCNSTTCIHGECDETADVCVCHADDTNGHWSGLKCDVCLQQATGYFTGSQCNTCVRGYFGAYCDTACPCNKCNSRGSCSRVEGTCSCDASFATGFHGTASTGCASCQANYYGSNCKRKCTSEDCIHGGCNSEGSCVCDNDATLGFWTGPRCDRCVSSGRYYDLTSECKQCVANYYGASCDVQCDPAVTCSGNGACSNAGTCE